MTPVQHFYSGLTTQFFFPWFQIFTKNSIQCIFFRIRALKNVLFEKMLILNMAGLSSGIIRKIFGQVFRCDNLPSTFKVYVQIKAKFMYN